MVHLVSIFGHLLLGLQKYQSIPFPTQFQTALVLTIQGDLCQILWKITGTVSQAILNLPLHLLCYPMTHSGMVRIVRAVVAVMAKLFHGLVCSYTPTSTNEDIEARICANEYSDVSEDVFI